MTAPRSARGLALLATGLYVVWGLLHLGLGVAMVFAGLAETGPSDELQAESIMFFACAAVLGAVSIGIAVRLNRINDVAGFWLNLGLVGGVDVAFVFVLLLPGHVDLVGGLSGPVLFAAAAITSALALARAGQPIVNSSTASAPPESRLRSSMLPRSSPVASVWTICSPSRWVASMRKFSGSPRPWS